jgi:hypothetical protein
MAAHHMAHQYLTNALSVDDLVTQLKPWANELAGRAGLAGICLGGSLIHEHRELDRNSDIDLFCYVSGPPSSAAQVAQWLDVPLEATRERAFLTEARLQLLGYDTNIKFFTIAQARRFVLSAATLDEHFLEEASSFDRFRVLATHGSNLIDILDTVRARRKEDIRYLTQAAFERYAKCLSWAASQWRLRREPASAMMVNLTQAYNCLLQLLYLQDDAFPVTTKWRGSKQYLARVPNGDQVFRLVNEWLAGSGAWEPPTVFDQLLRLESIVSEDHRRWPWCTTATDLWWHPEAADRGRDQSQARDVAIDGRTRQI